MIPLAKLEVRLNEGGGGLLATRPRAPSGPGCPNTGTFASPGPLAWTRRPASCPSPGAERARPSGSEPGVAIYNQCPSHPRLLVQHGLDWQPSRSTATFCPRGVDLGPHHLGCPRGGIVSIAFSRVEDSFVQQIGCRAPSVGTRMPS